MSSRFERRRPAGDRPAPTFSVLPTDEPLEDERPWQTVVRRLRRLFIAQQAAPQAEPQPGPKPELRLIPGGRSGDGDERRGQSAIVRGRWQ
jgi:hypothetical protein